MLQGTGDTQSRSKLLRQQMSSPEIKLWLALKTRPDGFKFRKQHPSGPYTADFYCHAARMIVEVDGANHDYGDRPQRDAVRDRWFESRGLAVLRVTATEVLDDCDSVVTGIATLAASRLKDEE